MNRSYSHNFRTFGANKNKSTLSRSSANFQFRTVWKTRDTHQLCNKPKQSQNPITTTVTHQSEQQSEKQDQTAAHQQMREFIKMMKKNSSPQQYQISNHRHQAQHGQLRPNLNLIYNKASNNPCQSSRSVKSSRSVQSSVNIRDSKAQSQLSCCERKQKGEVGEVNQTARQGLEILQKKLEDVIQNKLSKFAGRTKEILTSRIFQDDIDKEVKNLVQKVRIYYKDKNKQENQDQIESDIRHIQHKISIIEKAIASSSTQHQILKKYYSSTQKIRKNFATVNKSSQKHSMSCQKFVMPSPPSIHFQTTTGTAYIQPSRNSYASQGQKCEPYIPNRQPMPRSVYQRQFIYYGIVPTFPKNTFHENNLNKTDSKLHETIQKIVAEQKEIDRNQHNKNKENISVYKNQFKLKQVTLVNSKELDCRQDKYKNLDVNFMGNKSDLASIYQKNLKNAYLMKNQENQLNKQNRLKAKNDKHNKSTIQIQQSKQRTKKNNSFSKKAPQSANPSHHITQSQNESSKLILPFNYKTQHQAQFKNPYTPSRPQTSMEHSQSQFINSNCNNFKQVANLTSQKGKKGVLESFIKQKNLNNLKYSYKYQYAL